MVTVILVRTDITVDHCCKFGKMKIILESMLPDQLYV